MKIIITEKVNKELLDWQAEQKEETHIVSWTAEINYKPQQNETNLYHFMRQGKSEYLIQDLPFTKQFVLNHRSTSGSHQLEFKDDQQIIVAKVYLREYTQFVERLEIIDRFGETLSNLTYSGKDLVQQINYDVSGHPVENQFWGHEQKITTYWGMRNDKLSNVGMSLVTEDQEIIYNSYWDWHFSAFREIISSFADVSEIISYEAPTLSIDMPNRRVQYGELMPDMPMNQPKKWMVGFQQQNFWKPRTDVSKVAKTLGYQQINFDTPYVDSDTWIAKQLEKHCLQVKPGDLVVWQYPKYSPQLELTVLNWFHQRKIRVASFIHDISLLREDIKVREHYLPESDKILLNSFDANIIPENFVQPLYDLTGVVLKNIVALAPYDFMVEGKIEPAQYSQNIVYAGSLVKFPKLQDIDFNLTVYGEKNFSNINIENPKIFNGGFLPAEELAKQLNEGFGLIWDEDKKNSYRQAYTKWNWPYKFSLYMAAGLPVIAWSDSAIAELIKAAHVGIVVDNLSQVSYEIKKISTAEFDEMASNAAQIGSQLAQGKSTKAALNKLEEVLSKKKKSFLINY
ncbi:hypothetical protein LKI_07905 [Leuconostoc kimchii IMSNU 11154]|uniref:Glycosyltransferase n=1 Tax=Leuconostoc kimchii (strain IMSNU 11154 / KCTC 2386 / IH25) TaxID=762051 RepID=D5T4W8_LEUKI|nr:glycosyl transferase [Leuconostoc kimchii]ADG41120.1 hypothetical protein LKI_07905 [Leuconostoc kimchii IMSNU 11154]